MTKSTKTAPRKTSKKPTAAAQTVEDGLSMTIKGAVEIIEIDPEFLTFNQVVAGSTPAAFNRKQAAERAIMLVLRPVRFFLSSPANDRKSQLLP